MDQDAARVRSLAERLLVHITGMENGPLDRARMTVGAVPHDVVVDLPIPSDAVIMGGATLPTPWAGHGRSEVRVALEMPREPDASVEAVAATASATGWREPARLGSTRREMGGFASWPERTRTRTFCRGRRGPAVSVAAAPRAGGGSELLITLRADDEVCAEHSEEDGMPAAARVLPVLYPPAGVLLRGEGGGGGGGSWTSTALADGELPVRELVAHFAGQMERAGWDNAGGSATAQVTVWTHGEGWTATLAVVALPTSGGLGPRRWLLLRADAVGSDDDEPRASRTATIVGP